MENAFCAYIFVFFLPVLFISLGLIYIFKKDWAWSVTSMMLKSVNPQRTSSWEFHSTINGVIMLVFGLAILIFLITKL